MDQRLIAIFVSEIRLQCRFSLEAFNAMVEELKRTSEIARARSELRDQMLPDPDGNHIAVFFFSYSFLVHAAIVSKILWPSTKVHPKEIRTVGAENVETLKKTRNERGSILRNELEIPDGLAIQQKSLRDDLEHYDERLEAWYLASPRRNFVDMNLFPRSGVQGIDEMDFRRNLDPNSMSFFIEGNDYDFAGMANELKDIYDRCAEWMGRHDHFGKPLT